MKTLILTIAIVICALQSFAQFDTILTNGNNGKIFIIPNNSIPDKSTYKVIIPKGGKFTFKLENFISGSTQFNLAGICGISFEDSATTCGAGLYGLSYTNKSGYGTYINMKVNFQVNIIDSTPSSPTFGQTPDTISTNPQTGLAKLSVGPNFWSEYGEWHKIGGNNQSWTGVTEITVPPGTYAVMQYDYDGHQSFDTTVVLDPCTPPTINLGADTIISSTKPMTLDAGVGYTYAWSTSETTQTIDVWTNGIYTVTVSNDCGSASDKIFVDITTSISDPSTSVHINNIYVSGNNLIISGLSNNQNLPASLEGLIEVYNLTGQKVITSSSTSIDISSLSSGVYIARVGNQITKFMK